MLLHMCTFRWQGWQVLQPEGLRQGRSVVASRASVAQHMAAPPACLATGKKAHVVREAPCRATAGAPAPATHSCPAHITQRLALSWLGLVGAPPKAVFTKAMPSMMATGVSAIRLVTSPMA